MRFISTDLINGNFKFLIRYFFHNEYFIKGSIFFKFSTHSWAKIETLSQCIRLDTRNMCARRGLFQWILRIVKMQIRKCKAWQRIAYVHIAKRAFICRNIPSLCFCDVLRFDNIPLNTARHVTSCTRSASIVRFVVFARVDLYFWKVSSFASIVPEPRAGLSRNCWRSFIGPISIFALLVDFLGNFRARDEWSKMHLG